MTTEEIKRALAQHRQQEAAFALFKALRPRGAGRQSEARMGQRVAVVRVWLRLLTEVEQFVVTKHLVVGCPSRWSRWNTRPDEVCGRPATSAPSNACSSGRW